MFFRPKPDTRLRLPEMLRLRKAWLADPLPPDAAREHAAAERRCLDCHAKALCDEAVATQDARSAALFCPNSHYIQRLRNASMTF